MRSSDASLSADMFASMAESLLEDYTRKQTSMARSTPPHATSIMSHAQPVVNSTMYLKPPRDVFYRNTLTYTTKANLNIPLKKCSSQVVCMGRNAVIKCFSCVMFDDAKLGYYCAECFRIRHPYCRVKHVYADISQDESIPYVMSVSQQVADAVRYEKEGKDLLARVQAQSKTLEIVQNSSIEEKMRDAGRRTVQLEDSIRRLQLKPSPSDMVTAVVHDNSSSTRQPSSSSTSGRSLPTHARRLPVLRLTPTTMNTPYKHAPAPSSSVHEPLHGLAVRSLVHNTAATCVQAAARGFIARLAVSRMFISRVLRATDALTDKDFFFNTVTHTSSWLPPRFIHSRYYAYIPYKPRFIPSGHQRRRWCVKNGRPRRRSKPISNRAAARIVINTFVRCCFARKSVLARARETYVRVWDADYELYYYWDTRLGKDASGATTWDKPCVFLNEEEPRKEAALIC